jgi:chromosomal replication initiation ATPase DnaA
MFREPWFSIIEVHESTGRSMADIAAEVAAEHGVEVAALRGSSQANEITWVRRAAFRRIHQERPDLSSGQIARYFHREGSSVRHAILCGERIPRPLSMTKNAVRKRRLEAARKGLAA